METNVYGVKEAFVLLTFMERTYAKLSMKIVFGRFIQNCHKNLEKQTNMTISLATPLPSEKKASNLTFVINGLYHCCGLSGLCSLGPVK